jgi:hypothetical protein
MALKLVSPGNNPISIDGYDADFLTLKGGEIGRLIQVPYVNPASATSDKAAANAFDGYHGTTYRTVVSHTLPTTTGAYRPLFLLDEGDVNYGTMYGVVCGGYAGASVPNPSNLAGATTLGYHTALGSGMVTCWDKPGIYAVTLDATAGSVTSTSSVSTGDALYVTTAGKLTLTSGEAHDSGASGGPTIVGRFMEFNTNRSLVTTPSWIGNTSVKRQLTEMVFSFRIEN